ncbi:MAG TPA: hypothetical protein VFZ58_00720 [Candidatus Saccharimonadales bacterium]
MRAVRNVLNYLRHITSSKVLVVGVFVAAMAVSGGVALSQQGLSAEAAGCKTNDIILCGVANAQDAVNKINQNAKGDLDKIYSAYLPGFSSADLAQAVEGVSHKNGTITVNGKVVATGARSIGRNPQPSSTAINLGGGTYHESPNQTVFVSDNLPTLVVMKGDVFQYAVIKGCGNPEKGTPTAKPATGKCDSLTPKKISRNEFQFDAKASTTGNGKIVKYSFTTDDGQTKEVPTTAGNASANFSFAKEGKHVVKVGVVVEIDGQLKTVTDAACQTEVEVEAAPVFECVSLAATIITPGQRNYRFTLTYRAEGGATLENVDFDFGDGQSAKDVKPSNPTTLTTDHEYSKKGDYTAIATLHFKAAGQLQDKKCQVPLNVPEKPCEENPNTAECNPCPTNPSLPKDSPACGQAPPNLPATGPAEFIGGTLGATGLAGAGYYFRNSRRKLIDTILRRK